VSDSEPSAELLSAHARIAELERELAKAMPIEECVVRLLAHELRAPLAPLLTAVQLLEESSTVAPDSKRWIAVVRRNVHLEARLIDDAMDLLRIRRGIALASRERALISVILRGALEAVKDEATHKGIEPELLSTTTRKDIETCPAWLQHALWNLLRASLKSTPQGGAITLRARDEKASLVLEVVHPAGAEATWQKTLAAASGAEAALVELGTVGFSVLLARELVTACGGAFSARVDEGSLVYAIALPAG
jgi:signal transduction histidine kinase